MGVSCAYSTAVHLVVEICNYVKCDFLVFRMIK